MASLARTEGTRSGLRSPAPEAQDFLVTLLAGELYAVELARVKEIVATPKIARVPRAPEHVMGICSVRGLLVTVTDLRTRLGLPVSPISRPTRVLLSHSASGEVIGLLVDGVRNVVQLTSSAIEPASAALGNDTSETLLGIGRTRGEMLVLLNLAAIAG